MPDGNFLDGAKTYRLHILPKIPANNFVRRRVRCAERVGVAERSAIALGQQLTKPVVNADSLIAWHSGPKSQGGRSTG